MLPDIVSTCSKYLKMKINLILNNLLTGLGKLIHHRVYSLANYFKNEDPALFLPPQFYNPLWLETDNKLYVMNIISVYLRQVTIVKLKVLNVPLNSS